MHNIGSASINEEWRRVPSNLKPSGGVKWGTGKSHPGKIFVAFEVNSVLSDTELEI